MENLNLNYYKIGDGRVWDISNAQFISDEVDPSLVVTLYRNGQPAEVDYLYETLEFYGFSTGDLKYECMSLDDLKTEKLEELAEAVRPFNESDCQKMFFTSSLGFRVNGDRKAIQDLEGLALTFDLVAQDGQVSFMDYDNQWRTLSKEQITTLRTEHSINGQNLYQQKWQYKAAINQASSASELKEITFTFSMLDFSVEA